MRSSASISLNHAEGNAKRSEKEKLRYYEIAHGSFRESLVILELEKAGTGESLAIADLLGASLFKLTRAFQKEREI